MSTDLKEFTDDLSRVKLFANPEELATRPLDNVAFYDFAFHKYLLPEDGYLSNAIVAGNQDFWDLSGDALAFLDDLHQHDVSSDELDTVARLLVLVEHTLTRAWYNIRPNNTDVGSLLRALYGNSLAMQDLLLWWYRITSYAATEETTIDLLYKVFLDWMSLPYPQYNIRYGPFYLLQIASDSIFASGHVLPEKYPFDTFHYPSTNVGLRLVYRQEWKPLGSQPGEIVRTIPLGPGQKDRVTVKIVRRQKRTSTLETQTESETTTESSDSAKDSSEIVNDAKDTSNWNETLHVGGTFLGIGASSDTVLGGYSEEQSKRTASHLSETMRKTASKLRRQTKVVVSTESEVSYEQEHYSEISNPNNEIAITYEYHKLQQQYEVFTYLAEVQSVIYVAEEVPAPSAVNEEWIRKHDWILAKVLKDESHRATLNELIQDADEETLSDIPFAAMHSATLQNFAKFDQGAAQGQQGLSIPDIYGEPQRIYQQQLRDNAARQRANLIRGRKRSRLYQHLRDNILYYCRAIWIHEDPDQRLLRYKKEGRRVPIEWQRPAIFAANQPVQYTPTGNTAPLGDVIDPTGPIGYSGNYAVFLLRPRPKADAKIGGAIGKDRSPVVLYPLEDILAIMREHYHKDGELVDPALTAFVAEAEELKQTKSEKFENPSHDEIVDILSYIPQLGKRIVNAQTKKVVGYEPDALEVLPISVGDYGKYLYRKNGTRRFLVDSNNLYLNIRASEGAALEPFKRAHRYIDVLKEYENLVALGRKNERREQNLDSPTLFDPDIEKVIVVDDTGGLAARHAALHTAMGTASSSGTSVSSPLSPESAGRSPSTPTTSVGAVSGANPSGGGTS